MTGAEPVVRPWRIDDAEGLTAAVEASAAHLRPWVTWVAREEPMAPDERRAWIAAALRDFEKGDDRLFGMFVAGEVVGGCGLHRRVGPGGLEIGYWVHAAHLRRGIATRGVRRLIDIAFADPGVRFVEIHHDVANVRSAGVPETLGFTRAGERPREHDRAPLDAGTDVIWRLERRSA